jgi:organic hydroperoxide reductase OsmC/OhrA
LTPEAMGRRHIYRAGARWTAGEGEGTKTYKSYSRTHDVIAPGKNGTPKTPIVSTSGFHSSEHYNPEELLVGAISSCHMLWYLHLCAENGVVVVDYRDEAEGVLRLDEKGEGKIASVTLRPSVTIASGDAAKAEALHHEAHKRCFVANSVNFPVGCEPVIVRR